MNRILAIAPNRQYMVNWIKDTGLPESLFIYVDDPDYLKGWVKEVRYVWIQSPHCGRTGEQISKALRELDAVNLPLDTKEWPISEFPQHG